MIHVLWVLIFAFLRIPQEPKIKECRVGFTLFAQIQARAPSKNAALKTFASIGRKLRKETSFCTRVKDVNLNFNRLLDIHLSRNITVKMAKMHWLFNIRALIGNVRPPEGQFWSFCVANENVTKEYQQGNLPRLKSAETEKFSFPTATATVAASYCFCPKC